MNNIVNDLKNMLWSVMNLIHPDTCLNCQKQISHQKDILCIKCSSQLVINNNFNTRNNCITSKFKGRIQINSGYHFFEYQTNSIIQKLLQELKYHNREDIGTYLGNWIGDTVSEERIFQNIDYIIPVPIHNDKLKKRGYNQLDSFCQQVALKNKMQYAHQSAIRIKNNSPQAQKSLQERIQLEKVSPFKIIKPTLLENKNILLVDDVITTGTTMESFAKEFKNINCQINILCISLSK